MTAGTSSRSHVDNFFELSARGSTLTAEIRGGVVTFIAMAYIVVLNPIILSDALGRRRQQVSTSRRSPQPPRSPQGS